MNRVRRCGQADRGPILTMTSSWSLSATTIGKSCSWSSGRAEGTFLVWANPFTSLRVPKIFNLRTDPYERADITSNTYYDWLLDHVFALVPAQAYVGQFLMTFKDY